MVHLHIFAIYNGASVIDYCVISESSPITVTEFKIEHRVESKHLPIMLELLAKSKCPM